MPDTNKVKELLRLNDYDICKVWEFYDKSESDVKRDISIIREWLKQQPHLPDDEDEERLERILISNKFRLEQTKKKLENLYTFKNMYLDAVVFYDVLGEMYHKALKRFYVAPLPKMTANLERIVFFKSLPMSDYRPECYFVTFIVLELLKTYDSSIKFIYIFDEANVCFDDLKKCDFVIIQKAYNILINSICATFSKIVFLNVPSYYDIFIKLLKLVMKPKLFDRVSSHKNVESVYNILPRELLPIEYGGDNGSLYKLHDEWQNVIKDHAKFFKEIVERKSKEELRIGELRANELFGIEGSFKKLNLD